MTNTSMDNPQKTKPAKDRSKAFLTFILALLFPHFGLAAELSITIDDPNTRTTPLLNSNERNNRIIAILDQHHLKSSLFVCGTRIDNSQGRALLQIWSDKGHIIANHSYSHLNFNSTTVTFEQYAKDFEDGENIIKNFSGFTRLYRFPNLKEGNTAEKRDQMRLLLHQKGYKNGHVTIDASDWYVDQRMSQQLEKNPSLDTTTYRDYYLRHIWDRATFYHELSTKVLGREIKHTLLLHHNLLNALYLDDLIKMFKLKGWKVIDASGAFEDSVFEKEPAIIPAGESLIWALAKETGKFEDLLRYPGEDGVYQKEEMDRLGL